MIKKTAYVVPAAVCVLLAVAMSGCGKKEVAGVPGTVATVNGDAISNNDFIAQLTRDSGTKSLSTIIEQKIILQWAKDEKVEPTDKQIEEQINALKRNGIYDDQVKTLGEDGLKQAIKVRQATMNIEEKLKPTPDKTLEALYNANKTNYVHGPQKFVQIIVNADSSKIDEAAAKLNAGASIDEVSAEFMDKSFSQGPLKTPLDPSQPRLPKPLSEAVKNTAVGQVSKPFALSQPGGASTYGILKVLKELPKQDLKFADVKDEVAGMVAMRNLQQDPQGFQSGLDEKKRAAKIDVNMDSLKSVITDFKYPAPPPQMMGMPQGMRRAAPRRAPSK